MKKTKILSIVSLLLLAATLFTSCNAGKTDNGETPREPQQYTNATVANNYLGNLSSWLNYITFETPEKAPIYTEKELWLETKNLLKYSDDVYYTVETKAITVVEIDDSTDPATETEVKIATETTETWYDINTGKVIKTYVTSEPVLTAGKAHEKYDLSKRVEYDVTYLERYDLLGVAITTYSLKAADPEATEPLDKSLAANYEPNMTAEVYFGNGKLFMDNFEDITFRNVTNTTGRYLVDINDTTYLVSKDDHEIIKTFPLGLDYDVPVYDKTAFTPYNYNPDYTPGDPLAPTKNYAYAEIGNYKYVITEAAPIDTPIGDRLVQRVTPDIQITVFDGDYNPVMVYDATCDDVSGYAILPNGNIYICEQHILPANAETFDIDNNGAKLDIEHKIINVANKTVDPIDFGFVTTTLFNENTNALNTLMSTTAATGGGAPFGEVTVKEGYTIAQIRKYASGKLDQKIVYAVFNANMEIVAELAPIMANQIWYPAFYDENTVLVHTKVIGSGTSTYIARYVTYALDTSTGKATVFNSDYADYQVMDGGYYRDRKVYDKNWRIVADFSDKVEYFDYQVINGDLWFREYFDKQVWNDETDKYDTVRGEYIRQLQINYTSSDGKASYSMYTGKDSEYYSIMDNKDFLFYTYSYSSSSNQPTVNLYSISGDKTLFSNDYSGTETKTGKMVDGDETYTHTFTYKRAERYNRLIKTDNGYVLEAKVTLTNNSTSYDAGDYGLQNEYVSYKYYTIK